ncbi:TlpA family protein disulfide reductase [Marinoscillum sp.]|uniref:TlpA family protein disulfide reductase n=1 Tax=Marinoscillum sp. TaxID=2024838 RepID=UPI003BA85B16
MKNTAFMIFGALLFFACTKQEAEAPTTTISGTITNPKSEIISFRVGEETLTDSLDAEGGFNVTVMVNEPTEVRFNHGGEYGSLYIRPGDAVSFSLETSEFDETLTFSGDAADINNYKASLVLLNDTIMSFKDLMVLEEEDYIRAQDSIYALRLASLDSVSDEVFKMYTTENFKWDKYSVHLNFERYHQYYLKLKEYSVSDDFYAFRDELDVNDSTNMEYPSFLTFVDGLVSSTASEVGQRDSLEYYEAYNRSVDSLITLNALKDHLLYNFIKVYYTYMPVEYSGEMIADWKELGPEPDNIEEVDQMVEKWSKLTPGNPAPDFAYESIDGDTLTMADFKGSVVYIDVWATWCGPCIGEHPYMEKLQEQFKDKNVTFLAVSIDDTQEPWKKMVAKKKLGGVHVFAPGAWDASIIEDYMIRGIPRFILIDQEGKIVDATAARPSGDIATDIEALLKSV